MFKWMDRVYVNARKKIFKNMDTGEILNLELQDDPDNISQDSETPITAHCLNLAQQELIDDLGKTYTGTNITAPTVAGWGRIKKLYGQTVEEGTGDKSPDNPYELKCVGDDVNLFDINWINTTLPTSANFLLTDKGIKLSSGNYCFWVKLEDGRMLNNSDMGISFWNGDTRVSILGAGDTANITQEQASVISTLRLYFANTSYAGKKIKEIKLHKGSIKTAYSPYGYGTVENISTDGTNSSSNVAYVDKPLCSVGDIRDELDYINKKIIRRCDYFDSSMFTNISLDTSTSNDTICCFTASMAKRMLKNRNNVICNAFKNIAGDFTPDSGEHFSMFVNYDGVSFYIKKTTASTVEEFQNYLARNTIKFVGILATPTIEDIECSDKIVQYNGTTNVYNRDGADIEVSLTNSEAISDINENIKNVENKQELSHTYSTEEQVVGTWIDGKPLYRKVIQSTIPSTISSTGTGFEIPLVQSNNINKIWLDIGNSFIHSDKAMTSANTTVVVDVPLIYLTNLTGSYFRTNMQCRYNNGIYNYFAYINTNYSEMASRTIFFTVYYTKD